MGSNKDGEGLVKGLIAVESRQGYKTGVHCSVVSTFLCI